MAVNQNNQAELRYIKRQNLEQESKLVQGYYRDIIRSYGVDCKYYKLKTIYPEIFNSIVNKNNIIRAAYGYEPDPTFQLSAELITYMEVENDIFQLNKFGGFPSTNVNFYFDSNDFMVALASQLGQYKEYKIHDNDVEIEFSMNEIEEMDTIRLPFETDILSGIASISLGDMTIDFSKKFVVPADIVESSKPHLDFPVNEYIYKSFNYELTGANPDDCIVNFEFKLEEPYPGQYKIKGKLNGAVLFRDFAAISKYKSDIHPEVGDVVTIDFPDAKSREQYEITEAVDINLANDGVNPLLHKYIWKCKAIRYVPNASRNIPEVNEETAKVEEKFDFMARAQEEIAKKISEYPNNEDYIYGTYSRPNEQDEVNKISPSKKKILFDSIEDNGSLMTIMKFSNGASLQTNGFDLFFQNPSMEWFKLTQFKDDTKSVNLKEELDFLKSTDDMLVFVNVSGEHKILCQDFKEKDELEELSATELQSQFCLNSLNAASEYTNGHNKINNNGDEFYKFSNSKTLLFAIDNDLFCKLGSNKKIFKLN